MKRTALWEAVKKAQPHLTDPEVDELLVRASRQERDLVLKGKLNLDQAREIANQDLFPPNLDPWAGDEEYDLKPKKTTPA